MASFYERIPAGALKCGHGALNDGRDDLNVQNNHVGDAPDEDALKHGCQSGKKSLSGGFSKSIEFCSFPGFRPTRVLLSGLS